MGNLAAWSKDAQPVPRDFQTLGPNVWKSDLVVDQCGLKIVGTPFGTDEYVKRVSREYVNEEVQLLDHITQLASLQISWLLVYFCAVPRLNHLLRTLSPRIVEELAQEHDQRIWDAFSVLFSLPTANEWDDNLQRVSRSSCQRQAKLPMRLGGCGLRDSARVAPAAYWASWADTLPVLIARYPDIGARMVAQLMRAMADADDASTVLCLCEAELAGWRCELAGWRSRPTWLDLAAGTRPPTPQPDETTLGEWIHGWQYHGSWHLEQNEAADLERTLALPSTRVNAVALGKTRLQSCRGRFAPAWLIVCPTSEHLKMRNEEINCCMKFRLGLAVDFGGPDAHGFQHLADNRGGRLNARHSGMLAGWRQVLVEAGGQIPDRNVERMLHDTHVPVPAADMRRLDLVVPGLNVAHGLALFCDVTVISPVSRNGLPRPGTSNRGGRLLEIADADNTATYQPVVSSGLGALYCLGCEVYGRWGQPCINLMQALVRERSRLLHPRVRRGTALSLQHRWWGILSVTLQKAVARAILRETGADLYESLLEPIPSIADLPVVP